MPGLSMWPSPTTPFLKRTRGTSTSPSAVEPQGVSVVRCQPFGELMGAVRPARYLDAKVGQTVNAPLSKNLWPAALFRVVRFSLEKICQVLWSPIDVIQKLMNPNYNSKIIMLAIIELLKDVPLLLITSFCNHPMFQNQATFGRWKAAETNLYIIPPVSIPAPMVLGMSQADPQWTGAGRRK